MATQLTNILTEAGTNEVEVPVFQLNGGRYGVNVAKVREILPAGRLTRLPQSHPAVRGVFQLREHVLALVDLRSFFDMPAAAAGHETQIIVTEFNGERMGFLVDHVERIFRISWRDMTESPWTGGDGDSAITSIATIAGSMVLMLDFERIAFRIAGVERLAAPAPAGPTMNRGAVTVLLADDSVMMRRMLSQSLNDAGFGRVLTANDGEDAWNQLQSLCSAGTPPDVVVTDIEMPRMDGLHLTKRVKEDPRLRSVPLIVFSSLVSDDNLKKCKAVGADRQLTKPQLPQLVAIVDELLTTQRPATVDAVSATA